MRKNPKSWTGIFVFLLAINVNAKVFILTESHQRKSLNFSEFKTYFIYETKAGQSFARDLVQYNFYDDDTNSFEQKVKRTYMPNYSARCRQYGGALRILESEKLDQYNFCKMPDGSILSLDPIAELESEK